MVGNPSVTRPNGQRRKGRFARIREELGNWRAIPGPPGKFQAVRRENWAVTRRKTPVTWKRGQEMPVRRRAVRVAMAVCQTRGRDPVRWSTGKRIECEEAGELEHNAMRLVKSPGSGDTCWTCRTRLVPTYLARSNNGTMYHLPALTMARRGIHSRAIIQRPDIGVLRLCYCCTVRTLWI
jgi:hypothetical protein